MRWVAGCLLVCAAVLKAAQLFIEPATTIVSPLGHFFVPVQIGVELALGIIVLSGLYWRTLRWLVLLLFTAFTGYSLYLALNGALSCGCFDPLHVYPWWTFLLDITIVAGLLFTLRHSGPAFSGRTKMQRTRASAFSKNRRTVIFAVTGAAVVTTALLVRYADHRTALAQGMSTTSGGLVVLEPEQWIGHKLPIADFIDADLSSGEWLAVIHRHDCAACQEALPRYEHLGLMGQHIALIEIPPYGYSPPLDSACRCCRLKDDREWFVQTPLEIHLRDGIVTAVKMPHV